MVDGTEHKDSLSGADAPTPRASPPSPPYDRTIKLDRAIAEGDLSLPTLIGRYEIEGRIGIGGFASVFAAHDPELQAPVAIKVLAENHSANVEVRKRFVAEARVARRLGSDRLIGVFDLGETDDGRPFVVMERATGTLRARLSEIGRPSRTSLIRLIDELGQCMMAIHEQGVVHRDIKPSNLLLRPVGPSPTDDDWRPSELIEDHERLVLADFGLARDISDGASAVTVGGGTAGYMAPEQADPRGKADYRADIYAATVVLAELTTGRHPERLDLTTAKLAPAVLQALDRSLAIDRERRPASSAEWRQELLDAYRNDGPTELIEPAYPRQRDAEDATEVQAVLAGDAGPVDELTVVAPDLGESAPPGPADPADSTTTSDPQTTPTTDADDPQAAAPAQGATARIDPAQGATARIDPDDPAQGATARIDPDDPASGATARIDPADPAQGATARIDPDDAASGATARIDPADPAQGATARIDPDDAASGATARIDPADPAQGATARIDPDDPAQGATARIDGGEPGQGATARLEPADGSGGGDHAGVDGVGEQTAAQRPEPAEATRRHVDDLSPASGLDTPEPVLPPRTYVGDPPVDAEPPPPPPSIPLTPRVQRPPPSPAPPQPANQPPTQAVPERVEARHDGSGRDHVSQPNPGTNPPAGAAAGPPGVGTPAEHGIGQRTPPGGGPQQVPHQPASPHPEARQPSPGQQPSGPGRQTPPLHQPNRPPTEARKAPPGQQPGGPPRQGLPQQPGGPARQAPPGQQPSAPARQAPPGQQPGGPARQGPPQQQPGGPRPEVLRAPAQQPVGPPPGTQPPPHQPAGPGGVPRPAQQPPIQQPAGPGPGPNLAGPPVRSEPSRKERKQAERIGRQRAKEQRRDVRRRRRRRRWRGFSNFVRSIIRAGLGAAIGVGLAFAVPAMMDNGTEPEMGVVALAGVMGAIIGMAILPWPRRLDVGPPV